jgi:hypothetical protein
MLDRLRRPDDGGIEDLLVGNFAGDLIAFLDQAVDGRALDAFPLLAELLEGLVEPLDLLLGLFEVVPVTWSGPGSSLCRSAWAAA